MLSFFLGASLVVSTHPNLVNWQRSLLDLKEYQPEAALTASYVSGNLSFEALSSKILLYSPEELSHLKEVRQIFDRIRHLLAALFLACVVLGFLSVFSLGAESLFVFSRAIRLGLLLTLGLLLAVTSYFPFLFSRLHGLLFPRGGFLFPSDSLIIQMFPESLFFRIAVGSLLLTVLSLFLALGVVKLVEKR